MNKIIKRNNGRGESVYQLICDDGTELSCDRWYEKKVNLYHIRLPKDNPSGRRYIYESKMDNITEFEFETKTEHRTGLVGGGWKSKLTDDEKSQIDEYEAKIEVIKKVAMSRETVKIDKNSIEGMELEIAKLKAKMAKKLAGVN